MIYWGKSQLKATHTQKIGEHPPPPKFVIVWITVQRNQMKIKIQGPIPHTNDFPFAKKPGEVCMSSHVNGFPTITIWKLQWILSYFKIR